VRLVELRTELAELVSGKHTYPFSKLGVIRREQIERIPLIEEGNERKSELVKGLGREKKKKTEKKRKKEEEKSSIA